MIPKIDDKTIEIGNKITTEMALELCKHYGFGHLISRIEEDQESFKDWIFDGASTIPDELFSRIFDIPSLTDISLRHDLKYAYGEPGNKEKKRSLKRGYLTMVLRQKSQISCSKLSTLFGDGLVKTSFSWGFARK